MGDTGRRYQSLEQPSRLATNTLAFGRTSFAFYTPSLFRLFCPSSDPRFTLTCLLSPPSPFCFLLGPGERPLISPMPGTTMAADDDGTGHPALVVMARSMFMSLLYSCHQKRRTCLTAPNVLIFLFIFIGLQTLAFLFFFFFALAYGWEVYGALWRNGSWAAACFPGSARPMARSCPDSTDGAVRRVFRLPAMYVHGSRGRHG